MDFQYAFRQAHKDRLEDAGIVQYRPADGFRAFKAERNPRRSPVQQLRVVFAAIVSSFMK